MAERARGGAWTRGLWFVMTLSLAVFVLLAADIRFDGALAAWDRETSAAIYASGDPEAREAWYSGVLSRPGDDLVVFPLLAVSALLVARYDSPARGALMAGAGFAGGAVLKLVKELVGRARPNVSLLDGPDAFMVIASDRSPAFPSGHTFDTALVYGLIVWFGLAALMRHRRLSPAVPVLALSAWAVLSVAMAAFRLLAGVHWVTDVVGALALAVAWLAGVLLVDHRLVARTATRPSDRAPR